MCDKEEIQRVKLEGISFATIKGEKGDKGEKGEIGERGIEGPEGKEGAKGRGLTGKAGPKGDDGIDGKDGKDGVDGKETKIDIEELADKIAPKIDFQSIKNAPRFSGGLVRGITTVNHDATLTGDGTDGSPLKVVGGGSGGQVNTVVAGTGISVDATDPANPIVTATSGSGAIDSVVAGTGISVDDTDPINPIVNNSAPDQTVSIAAGTNIDSVAGTYPNFTINATTQGGAYVLPTADATTLGGIKVGTRLSIDGSGVLSADVQAGGGDVVGPTGATDGAVALFDGATGKLLKDGGTLGTAAFSATGDFAAALGADDNYVTDNEKTVLSATDASKLIGRGSASGTGIVQEITLGTNLSMSGTTLNAVGGSGSGDVVGPASAVDSNFAAFDSTTGKLIKDSGSNASDFATAAQGSKADNALPTISFTDSAVTGKSITGFTSGAGTVSATDTILEAINKLDGNIGTKGVGTVTAVSVATCLLYTSDAADE